MLKDLVKVASRLNSLGLSSEANFIDAVVRKFAHREEVEGVDTSEEEAFEDGRRTPYKGRDGGHKRGLREDRSKFKYKLEELSPPIEEGAGEEYLEGFSYEDLSNDADDMFDSDGNLIDPMDFEQEIGNEGFNQYNNPEETYFRRSEPVGPGRGRGRGRSVYVPSDETLDRELEEDQDPSNWTDEQWARYESTAGPNGNGKRDTYPDEDPNEDPMDEYERLNPLPVRGVHSNDANDMQRLAKRLASLGLTKEARTLISIVKSAEDYLDEEEFSDDAWDDGDTGPHYYRDPRVDEEEVAMEEERMRREEEETRRINRDYYGHDDGNFATELWRSNRPGFFARKSNLKG